MRGNEGKPYQPRRKPAAAPCDGGGEADPLQLHHGHAAYPEGMMQREGDGLVGTGTTAFMEADASVVGIGPQAVPTGATPGNELILTFQGDVFVFDSVSREKVQAVLLLLGGNALNSAAGTSPSPHQHKKRKHLNFEKKIWPKSSKEAQRMNRNNEEFTLLFSTVEDQIGFGQSSDCSPSSVSVDSLDFLSASGSVCYHCATSRGPDGSKTLCNACRLMWENKSTLQAIQMNPQTLNLDNIGQEAAAGLVHFSPADFF